MKKLLSLTLLLALLAALGVGCSSDEDPEPEETTTTEAADEPEEPDDDTVAFDDWADEVDDLCATSRDDIDALGEPADLDELAELADEAASIYGDAIDDIRAVGMPDERSDEVEEWLELLDDTLVLYPDLVEAAEGGDEAEVEEIASEIEEIQTEAQDLATELGLDECDGSDDDTTDTTEAASDLTFEEWVVEADAVCADFSEITADLSTAVDEATSPEELAPLFRDAGPLYEDFLAEIGGLGVPDDAPAELEEWLGLMEEITPVYDALAEAAETGDQAAIEAAATPFAEISTDAAALAEELEMPSCATI